GEASGSVTGAGGEGMASEASGSVTGEASGSMASEASGSVTGEASGSVTSEASGGMASEAGTDSACVALGLALSCLLRLFAPILPYATEEVWSWWQDGSVHRAAWPQAEELIAACGPDGGDPGILDISGQVLSRLRKAKSEAKRSMRAGIDLAVITAPPGNLALIQAGLSDICDAGAIRQVRLVAGEELAVEVTLESPE
ncbi:MAG: class I tRNA ligase family protein, partial [Acidimicrobiales bacterium]